MTRAKNEKTARAKIEAAVGHSVDGIEKITGYMLNHYKGNNTTCGWTNMKSDYYDDPEGRENARQGRVIDRELAIIGKCKCGRQLDMSDHYAEEGKEQSFCFVCPKCGSVKYMSLADWDKVAKLGKRKWT